MSSRLKYQARNTVSGGDTLGTGLSQFDFDGAAVRVVMEGDMPWFSANDVCKALGHTNSRKAIADHVDEEDVTIRYILTRGGNQEANFVNESGLYALIFGSGKPKAKRFKRWVTSEVLPAIRKTGAYQPGVARLPALAEDEFALTPAFFARLYYALDRRLGAATLVWYLIDQGGLDQWIERSARKIAEDIGLAVHYSTIYKFSSVLAEEGILSYRVGDKGVPSRYRLLKGGLKKVLARIPMTDDLRPGLSVMELVADQNRLLRSH